MATQNQPVCSFNKFGHCKFQKKCRKMHISELCETTGCDVKACNLRHPKLCSFFRDYKYCKFFDDCSFSHKIHENLNDALEKEIDDIKENLNLLKEQASDKDKQIVKMENEIKEKENLMRNIYTKLEENIVRIDTLETKVKKSEDKIEYLEKKLEAVEKINQNLTINFPCDICDLIFKSESKLIEHTQETHANKETLKENQNEPILVVSEKSDSKLTKSDDKVFQCESCSFKSSSEHGIKIHKTKKHTHICQFCNQLFPNAVEKSNHTIECSVSYHNPPFSSPGPIVGRFPPRFPPRFSPRFPPGPMW